MNLIARFALVVLHLPVPGVVADAQGVLAPEDAATIRRIVCEGMPDRIGSQFGFNSEIVIPAPLKALYAKHPDGTVSVLLELVASGKPTESVSAAAYAVSLLRGPAVGDVCIVMFDAERYDVVDTDWGSTPRRHWLNVTKRLHRK